MTLKCRFKKKNVQRISPNEDPLENRKKYGRSYKSVFTMLLNYFIAGNQNQST